MNGVTVEIQDLPGMIGSRMGDVSERLSSRMGEVSSRVGELRERTGGVAGGMAQRQMLVREIGKLTKNLRDMESSLTARLDELSDELETYTEPLVRTPWTRRLLWMAVGAGVGMVAGYLGDPEQGERRRQEMNERMNRQVEQMRERATQQREQMRGQMADQMHDMAEGIGGTAGRVDDEGVGGTAGHVDDEASDRATGMLEERIRTEVLDRRDDVSEVTVHVEEAGTVSLAGTVPSADSMRDLIESVHGVEGVTNVRSELSVRQS